MTKIGSARCDEHGGISGAKGDQTGREVMVEDYYIHKLGWYVLRPKDPKVAKSLAKAMANACKNSNLGYSQSDRYSIIDMFRKYGALSKIVEKCNCDCSSLVRTCVWKATGVCPPDFYTGNAMDTLFNMGFFEKKKSVTSKTKLYLGDILCTKTKGHIAIVVLGYQRQ